MSRQSKSVHADGAEVVIAARKLTTDDHNRVFYLSNAAGFQVDLPGPDLGLEFTFIVKTAPATGSYTIKSNNQVGTATALFKGHVLTTDVNSATDSDFDTTAVGTITLTQSKAVAGDVVKVYSDGTNWFYRAECSVFDAISAA